MAERKTFPLRMDPALFAALQRWADDELRSLNGQIEYVLRDALRRRGRGANDDPPPGADGPSDEDMGPSDEDMRPSGEGVNG